MLTGVKTTHKTVGYDHKIIKDDLESLNKATKVDSMALHAQKAGKDTGFVTTTRVTHATPSSTYSHSANRYLFIIRAYSITSNFYENCL